MKKVLLFGCLVMTLKSFGQNKLESTGNAGIGTTSPAAPLHIVHSIGNTVLLEKSSNNYPAIAMKGANYISLIEGGDALSFYTNGLVRVNVSPNGNVGIGTTNPGFKLTVMGDSYANGQIYSDITSNEGGTISLINNSKTGTNVNKWSIYNMTGQYGNSLKFWRYSADLTNTGAQFILNDDGTSAFTGRLGIGTDNPQYLLDVRSDNNDAGLRVSTSDNAVVGAFTWRQDAIAISAGGYQSPDMAFNTSGNERMRISKYGNIGIGTANPSQKLAVNGTVLAKKVKVSQSAADWPDYVFDSSYQLPSLDSVSTFIQTNKHLPDIPSAATVEKDGHDLGEVQKLLLKKMEEMTLYMIQQQKEIESLRTKVAQLEGKK
jgi:hypothetical protein